MIRLLINRLKIWFIIFLFFPAAAAAQLQPILNNISTDSIMETIKELTGAVPIYLEGKIDTIKTRAVLSTYNRLAQKYIRNKLNHYGIQTMDVHFHCYDPFIHNLNFTAAAFNKNSTRPYWFCTDWGEIFSSEVFPPGLTSRNITGIPNKDRLDWISFSGPDTVAVMGSKGNFFFSTNNGDTWRHESTGLNSLADFIISGNFFIAADKKGKVYRSSDAGISWTTININVLFGISDLMSLSNSEIIMAGRDTVTNNGAAYRSTDHGANWIPIQYTFNEPLVSCTSAGTKFWIAGESGKIYYNNEANNLSLIYTPAVSLTAKKIVFADSLNGWLLSETNHIYRSADKGYNWTDISIIDTPSVIKDFIFTNSNNGIIAGEDFYGIISSNGGSTWKNETVPLAFVVIASIPGTTEPEKVINIIAHSDCIMNIPEITGWIECPGADDDGSGTAALIELARVFNEHPLKYTINFIITPDEELGGDGGCAAANYFLQNADTILFTFELDMIGYDPLNKNSLLIFHPNSPLYNGLSGDLNSLLNTAGIQLTISTEALGTGPMICLPYSYPQLSLFEDIRNPMNPNYHQITDTWNTLNPEYLTSVTKASALLAYYFSEGELLPVEGQEINTTDYFLSEAYPNPFNERSIINFSIPEREYVTLKVYDILGNEIAILLDKELPGGKHNIEFNASSLPSGVYFYRIETSGYNNTKKMIYLK